MSAYGNDNYSIPTLQKHVVRNQQKANNLCKTTYNIQEQQQVQMLEAKKCFTRCS